jgi:small subunit ribosomal protein S1
LVKAKSDDTAKKTFVGTPSTMEELLAQSATTIRGVKRWDTVEATVVEVTPKALYLDFGGKTDGVVTGKEYDAAKIYIRELAPGDKINAVVMSPESDSGYILMSLKKAASDQRWNQLEEAASSGEPVTMRVKEANKGGLMVESDGIVGFLPGSQVGKNHAGRMEALVGKNIEVVVMEADREGNRLIVSEKAVSEADDIEARKKLLSLIAVGGTYEGEVAGVVPFGLFVKVAHKTEKGETILLEGLVHISEISWEKVDDPSTLYKEGDTLQVKVIGLDENSGRLALSVKQLGIDPWEELAKKYTPEKHIKGTITKLAAYGAFVEIEKGLEGLIHISKIPAEQRIEVGDTVSCYVESIDPEHRRISLGLVLTSKPIGYK